MEKKRHRKKERQDKKANEQRTYFKKINIFIIKL